MEHQAGGLADILSGNPEWFRMMFENSADAMTLIDPATMRFIDGNDAFSRASGVNREDIPFIAPADLAPKFQADGRLSSEVSREIVMDALKNGSNRVEWLTKRIDGREEFIDVVTTCLPFEGRSLIFTSARNIDRPKKIEADLHLSEARWRRVFEQIPMSMQIFAPDGTTRQINKAYGELFGFTMEDLEHFNILHDEQLKAAGFQEIIHRAFFGEVSVIPPIPFEMKTAPDQVSKGIRWVGSTMFPVFDTDGRIIEVVCVHEDHTARKLAEDEVRQLNQTLELRIAERTAELKQSEKRFQQLFEFSPLGIAQVDMQGTFHQVNPAFLDLVQHEAAELIGSNYWRITNPELHTENCGSFEKFDQTGRFGPLDKEYINKAGTRIPVRLNGVGVTSPEGDVQIWIIAEDISARHAAEHALRESEEKFKALFEFSPLGMARVSWDGKLLQVNKSFAKVIGYTPEEATRLSYWDITPAKYEEQELLILELVQRDGRFGPFEKEYIHRDGHLVPIVINGMLIRGPHGDELWGIVEDITPRRKAEQAIRESEKKFRTLFESSSQGVMLHAEDHTFSEVNPAAAQLFGLEQAEIVGKHPIELAPAFQPDGQPSSEIAKREIEKCLEFGTARFEWVHWNATGRRIFLEVILSRIPHGDKFLMQAVVTDISERKRVEADLKRALERERELNQLKSNFVSMVSHEFRTPLGIIQSSAEILDDYLEQLEAAERSEQLQSIIKNSRRMAGLMEDVLLLGSFDSGRHEFVPKLLDLAGLCRRLVDEVRSTTDARCPIEFSTTGLPEEAMADERLLRHILLNLLSNAVKYSTHGQPVSLLATGAGGSVTFVVRDQGIGIPERDLPDLFEAFRRGSNVGQTPGTGLGLVIVKQSVELHQGHIDIESRQGQGTVFTVTIPLSLN
jgi:PAS domain S-box-containing protein